MKKIYLLLTLSLASSYAWCQTSILQDKSGASTFTLGANQFSLNAGDASVSGNLLAATSIARRTHYWDVNFKFASSNGVSTIYDGTNFKPSFNVGGDYSIGFGNESFFWGVKLNAVYFNLLKADQSNAFIGKQFWGPTLTFGYNSTGRISTTPLIFGASISYSHINNINDLKSTDVFQTLSVTKNDTTLTSQKGKKSGYSGDYHTSDACLINLDAYLFPDFLHNHVGVGGYGRFQLAGYQPRQNVGIGIIFGKEAAATNINFGILYQFTDVFNELGKEKDFIKRGGVNIVAGYKF